MWRVPIGLHVTEHVTPTQRRCFGSLWSLLEADSGWRKWISVRWVWRFVVQPCFLYPVSAPWSSEMWVSGCAHSHSHGNACCNEFCVAMDCISSNFVPKQTSAPSSFFPPPPMYLVIEIRIVTNKDCQRGLIFLLRNLNPRCLICACLPLDSVSQGIPLVNTS